MALSDRFRLQSLQNILKAPYGGLGYSELFVMVFGYKLSQYDPLIRNVFCGCAPNSVE